MPFSNGFFETIFNTCGHLKKKIILSLSNSLVLETIFIATQNAKLTVLQTGRSRAILSVVIIIHIYFSIVYEFFGALTLTKTQLRSKL